MHSPRPMMNALREKADSGTPYDTSSVTTIVSTGAMFSADVKSRNLRAHAGRDGDGHPRIERRWNGADGGTKDNVNTTAKFGAMPNTKVFGPDDEEVVPDPDRRASWQ